MILKNKILKTIKLSECCYSIVDGDHQSMPVADNGIPFIIISDIKSNMIDFSNARFVPSSYYESLDSARKPQKGDILYSVKGSFGIPVYVTIDKPFTFQRDIAILKCNERINSRYLYYVLKSDKYYKIADSLAIGSAQRAITLTTLRNLEIPFPDIQVQNKIARILSAYDDLIENNRCQIKLLEEAARRLYREWFVDFRFPGHEQVKMVDGVPEEWKSCTVSEIAEINSDSISSDYSYPYIDYIDIGSVNRGRIENETRYSLNEAPGRAKRIAHDGDIIWGMVRPNLQSYALILHPSPTNVFSTGFAIISAQRVPFTFLYCAVTDEKFISYLVNCTNGAAYPAVKPIHFEKAVLLLPANEILQKYHNIAEPIFRKIAVLQTINHKAKYSLEMMIKTVIDYDK